MRSISIHAPPRGATTGLELTATTVMHFNSRPSARGDRDAPWRVSAGSAFQFTPLREGRREEAERGNQGYLYFNSRPSARGDSKATQSGGCRNISIHAPPRGATRTVFHADFSPYFNSRPSARGDIKACGLFCAYCISIHAPPRGATTLEAVCDRRIYISIHAPPRGATEEYPENSIVIDISIHAPPRGATR